MSLRPASAPRRSNSVMAPGEPCGAICAWRKTEASSSTNLQSSATTRPSAKQRERVDLQQFGVARAVGGVKLFEDVGDLRLGVAEIEAGEHVGDVVRRRRAADLDQQAADRLRLFGGDLLDVHAAFGGEQDQRLARGGVVQHRGIELARDLALLLDQQALDRVVADRHAEDLAGDLFGFRRRCWRA